MTYISPFDIPAKNSSLFPDAEDRRRFDEMLTILLAEAVQRVVEGPVSPNVNIHTLRNELMAFDFQKPIALEDVFSWVIPQMETGLVHFTNPCYLGLFNPAPTFPAQCAARIAAIFNPQLASATTSPAAVEMEAHVIRSIAKRAGFGPESMGHFTSGGSEANYTALICALTKTSPDFAKQGSRAFSGQPVFYISQDSHFAWIKIAHQAGIGRDAVRLVPTDGNGRLCLDALADLLQMDRAKGYVPFMLVATAGTTNAGMIDPLEYCADIAQRNMLWYHIDAAWGGGLIASKKLIGLLAGIEMADSVTIDAHKWFATTMGCGIYITKHSSILTATFNVTANFMPPHAGMLDPYKTTAQWSRRFTGLGLFLSLAVGGWKAHAAHVEKSVELAQFFSQSLQKYGWSVVNEPALAVVCVEPPAGSSDVPEIVKHVVASGRGWVSMAIFEGRNVVRACVTNGETTPADITKVVEALEEARAHVPTLLSPALYEY